MPGKIKVKILAGRNLPVMDRSGDTTDAYVEIKFGNTTYKTDVCRKTLNPQWNSEWYRFEVDDAELQDEPLQLRLMDHDTYSANDAIGKVYLNLNPLLLPGLPPPVKNIWTLEATMNSGTGSQGGSVMTGWIPVFDTMHGIRGEVNIIVKVELFSDFNKFRQSSCGVQFFYSPNVPHGYHAQVIHGFVEELIVSDDPEYKWIDKIRTPRASNEARQTLFFKLSGEVQRKIGLKALDLGGNAVIGYCQNFDLEGESGIVARGIGTAVTLIKLQDITSLLNDSQNVEDNACFRSQSKTQLECSESDDNLPLLSHSPSPLSPPSLNVSITTIGNSFPKYESSTNLYSPMRITNYSASSMKKQMSLQSSPSGNLRKIGAISTQSLSDDLISESAIRTMLALEDMRGERTSAFSRGLKNLRYFPRKVIQMKPKVSDSVDEESDDSTYSSTWSVGAESARSSFSELRQSIRRKRFTHKKNQPEGMAALLIRSVHAGFPLDSVLEDRETPAPSPVNFLETYGEISDDLRVTNNSDEGNSNEEVEEKSLRNNEGKHKLLKRKLFFNEKDENYDYTMGHIPMITSSESDTSTSEDDDPSESSTNYNILDDFSIGLDSSIEKNNENSIDTAENAKSVDSGEKKALENSRKQLFVDQNDSNNSLSDADEEKATSNKEITKIPREGSFPEGVILDYDFEPDEIFAPLISSLASSPENELQIAEGNDSLDYKPHSFLRTSSSFKLKLLGKQDHFDNNEEDDVSFVATSTPVENKGEILFDVAGESLNFSKATALVPYTDRLEAPLIDFNELIESQLPGKLKPEIVSVIRKEEQPFPLPLESTAIQENLVTSCLASEPLKCEFDILSTEISNVSNVKESLVQPQKITEIFHDEKPTQENGKTRTKIPDIPTSGESSLPYKKYLFHSVSMESKLHHEKKEKTSKKVRRTETVIYKGPPKSKSKMCASTNYHKAHDNVPTLVMTAISPVKITIPAEAPDCHLRLPPVSAADVSIHTPCPEANPPEFTLPPAYTVEAQMMSERFIKNYRQHCMLDLIRTIDAKMMVCHMHSERKDSTRSRKKHRDRRANLTPSPESIHRTRHRKNSRSKSPERHHHHHHHSHHNHQASSLAIQTKSHATHTPAPSPVLTRTTHHPHHTSTEHIPKASSLIEPHPTSPKDKLIPKAIIIENYDESRVHEIAAKELTLKSNNDNMNSETIELDVAKKTTNSVLIPNESDTSELKSHSEGSLENLQAHLTLTKITNPPKMTDEMCAPCPPVIPRQEEPPPSPVHPAMFPASVGSKVSNSPATKNPSVPLHRRSSDSDLSITPKGNSLAGSDRSMGGHLRPSTAIVRTMNQDTQEMLEYPFITMQQYPPGFILNIGGLVSARSVKLIERISNLEEPEGRDAWWTEIRMEVRSHARALCCNVVLGYKEEISICDDVCVLNASGTAAVINLLNTSQDQEILLNKTQTSVMSNSMDDKDKSQQKTTSKVEKSEETPVTFQNQPVKVKRISESNDHEIPYISFQNACSLCHLPYNETSVPFRVDVSKCAICRRASVPDVLFTTIELPDNIPMSGRGVFLQATVCKNKRDLRGELNAKEISDCLPFLEYELHSLLLNKLKVKGMNAIFGLKVQVSVGERLVIGMAVGTAVFLTALPVPNIPQIASGNSWHNEEQLAEIQKNLIETVKKNREYYRLKPLAEIENGRTITTSDTDESDDDLPDLDLGAGTKDTCVLEVDDVEDMDRINLLMDERPPDDFHVVNTQTIPGLEDLEIVRNLQMFTQISRSKIPSGQFASMPSKYFARILQTIFFKLRRMVPCALCDMQFKVALPEPDEMQLTVVGMALGLGEPTKSNKFKKKGVNISSSRDQLKKTDDSDLIFNLDEDHEINNSADINTSINQSLTSISNSPLTSLIQKPRPKSPFRTKTHQPRHKHVPLKERYGVDITPLSYLPGGRIERYLGNLNFFFIRESTSIRENGGLSGFTHSFVTEILAIVRAHITALGGNAMVAFFMTQCVLQHSPHKNQGQCLINVGGDVVSVSYFGNEKHSQNC